MKVKRAIAVMVILVGLLGVFASEASAVPGWYYCNVKQLGMGWGNCFVMLTDTAVVPAFTNRWFILNPAYQKQLMAVGLTAVTNNMVVFVNMEPAAYSIIDVMYINQ